METRATANTNSPLFSFTHDLRAHVPVTPFNFPPIDFTTNVRTPAQVNTLQSSKGPSPRISKPLEPVQKHPQQPSKFPAPNTAATYKMHGQPRSGIHNLAQGVEEDESEEYSSEYESSESDDSQEDESEEDEGEIRASHLRMLKRPPSKDSLNELLTSPLFSYPVLSHAKDLASHAQIPMLSQYSLLAGCSNLLQQPGTADPRIFHNVAAPSSTFICGSQGSGKSHTLSCLLENCLISSKLGPLPRPLTGLVFHYDTFISDTGGMPCEAAYLSSSQSVKVRVLCPPSNIGNLRNIYSRLPHISVEELRLDQSNLNTKRMLDLMAVGNGSMPLYMQVVQRILREMRVQQQAHQRAFDYSVFRQKLLQEDLTEAQKAPLLQRLETLESFMVADHVVTRKGQPKTRLAQGTRWTPKEGELTIVDLSCPCVTAEMACSLFNICLSLFLEQDPVVGRVVALDEAHKYMGDSTETQTLTDSLLSTIRLQRHLGTRVIISTQEPTISPKLLDLCSITIVHRFTSPDWLRVLNRHLAGISMARRSAKLKDRTEAKGKDEDEGETGNVDRAKLEGLQGITITSDDPSLELFGRIVQLKVGEALLFAPSAILSLERHETRNKVSGDGSDVDDGSDVALNRLAYGVLPIRVRQRLTADGGKSLMAT
ncbi:hypothetical protein F4778DRAFT_748452 [Xylariomycetidae sp. FL2044]|nr:hypothetical protein F4778DRAFT_748452 [Xylariomycetidae sp. FL2044]